MDNDFQPAYSFHQFQVNHAIYLQAINISFKYHIIYWIPFVQKLTRDHMGNMDLIFLHVKFGNIIEAYLS
jgi:hypothetical protein